MKHYPELMLVETQIIKIQAAVNLLQAVTHSVPTMPSDSLESALYALLDLMENNSKSLMDEFQLLFEVIRNEEPI